MSAPAPKPEGSKATPPTVGASLKHGVKTLAEGASASAGKAKDKAKTAPASAIQSMRHLVRSGTMAMVNSVLALTMNNAPMVPMPGPTPAPAADAAHPADPAHPAPAAAPAHPAPAPDADTTPAPDPASAPDAAAADPAHPAPAPAAAPANAAAHGAETHDAAHGHEKKEWSTAKKIGVGVAATGGVLALGATAATVHLAGKAIEATPRIYDATLSGAAATARAPFTVAGHSIGTPLELAANGFEYGADEVIGAPHYEPVRGWLAPWKALKNTVKAVTIEPLRVVTGAAMATVGAGYGLLAGPIEGSYHALGGKRGWKLHRPKFLRGANDNDHGHDDHDHEIDVHAAIHSHDAHGHGHNDHGHSHGHDDHGHVDGDDGHGHETSGGKAHGDPHASHDTENKHDAHKDEAAHKEEEHHRLKSANNNRHFKRNSSRKAA